MPTTAAQLGASVRVHKKQLAVTDRPLSAQSLRDFDLIQRIQTRQEAKAYTELLNYYQRPLYHRIYRMVPQETTAEDLTMEVLARACQYLPTFQLLTSFRTWLFRMATNYCIDFLRRRRLDTVSLSARAAGRDRRGRQVS